ncbi:MAG: sulfite exporter TauE/SafE family protein [Microcystis aeruginosa]
MDYSLLAIFSFFIGIIVGLTGIGGSSLITPLLIFVFQVPATTAVGSDVVAAGLMKVVGTVRHWQQQTIELEVVKWLVIGSVPGSLLGLVGFRYFQQNSSLNLDQWLPHIIGLVLMIVTVLAALELLISLFFPDLSPWSWPKLDLTTRSGQIKTTVLGAILGYLVGLTSISSGSLFALVLMTFFHLDSRKLVGTDLSQASILLTCTSIGHLGLGTVDWNLVLPIWLGAIPGVVVGARLSEYLPKNALKILLYTVLVTVSWRLLQPT